ncbi:phage tail length tape measure family protein [Massilia sp. BKSP1R2A-1]|uniref:phage tail length tape measure family protein n=1 Tax=Massilia sp. BKSP1R2A-1 TaxID=3422595 RepID=UPI003D32EEEE
MSDTVNTAEIRVVADASQVEAGLRPAVDAANRAGQAIRQTGSNASGAARNIEAAQRNIIASIQRTTMAMEAGGRTTAAYYEQAARFRGVDPNALTPYLNQLRAVEAAQAQATESTRTQAAAARELAQAQANKESFLAGLREQIALFGKSTEEVLRYRAAQAGASQEAAQLIVQLQNMRAAQEQVDAAARAAAQAQREAAQVSASRDAFIQSLREQIALFGLSSEEAIRYKAAQLGAAQAADPLIAQLRDLRLAQEQAAYGARMEAQAQREAAQARAGRDSFLKGLEQQAAAIGKTRTELLELQAAQMGVTTQAKPFIDQLRAAEQSMRAGGMSAAQMNAALRGVPAQLTDIVVSLQGGMNPMTVFLQQGGQLRDMFGSAGGAARALGGAVMGLVTPWTVAAAAVAVGVAAFKAGHDESIRFSRALALTNNFAGTTSGQMADMARNIGEVVGSQREGAKALTALAGTGAVTRQNLEWFGTVAVDAQHVFGKSVEDTVKEFAELGKSPLTALQSMAEKYHFVTAATYAQVKALQEQGRTAEAANVAQLAYADGINKQRQNVLDSLTDWERGWLRIKKAVSESVDGVIDFVGGREAGPQEQIKALLEQSEALESRVARIKNAGKNRDGDKYDPSRDRELLVAQASLDATVREINAIRDKTKASKDAAEAKAAEVRANELGIKWKAEENILLSRRQLMERDLEAARVEGKQNNLDEAVIRDRLMVIRRRYNDVYVEGIDRSLTALRRRGEVEDELRQRAMARIEAEREAGSITQEDALRQVAAQQLAQIDSRRKGLEQELSLVRTKIGSQREQIDLEGRILKLGEERTSRELQLARELDSLKRNRAQASDDSYNAGIIAAEAELKSLMDLVDAQVLSNAETGRTKLEVAELAEKQLLAAAALKEQAAAAQAALPGGERLAEIYRQQAAELRNLASAKTTGVVKAEMAETSKKELDELNKFLDPSRAQTFGEALREAFGTAGESLSRLTGTLDGFGKRQAEIAKQREVAERNRGKGDFDELKYQQTILELNKRRTQDQLASYGSMASAAAGFFGEQSKGYEALMTVSKFFYAAELAMTLAELVPKGISAVLGQAQGDPYSAFGRMAAMAAIVAGLGVAIGGVGGGSAPSLSESRQKAQGTGTMLGSDDKSQSIARSLDMIEKAAFQGLGISNRMLGSLRNIESGIGAFASQLVGSTGVSGKFGSEFNREVFDSRGVALAGGVAGGLAGAAGGAYLGMGASTIGMIVGGPLGMALGAALGAIIGKTFIGKALGSVFGGKQTVEDNGFTIKPTDYANIIAGNLQAMQYADVKTDGGWFRKDKTSTKTENLGADAERQITGILTSLYDSVFEAGKLLGIGADEFSSKLNGFVVDIGEISLKGLTGEEVQKELEAVFSKVGDQLAQYGVGGLESFQKIGEGYLETLTRVAAGYQTVTVVTDALGMTFGSVGLASIAARERLIDLAGGLEEFASSAEQFLTDFYTDKEQADALRARLQPTLDRYGIQSGADDSLAQFRDVVKSLKLETADGAQAFGELMQIMPAFKQLADFDKAKFEERLELQDKYDQLTMTAAQLLGKQRNALDESNRALFDQVRVLEERAGLQEELDNLTLTAEQRLLRQRDALDASNRSLFDQVQLATKAKAAMEERKGLQEQLDQLTMTSAQLLEKQRNALDESNRALFDQVQAARAQKDATEKAAQAIKAASDAAAASVRSFGDAVMSAITRAQDGAKALRDFNDALLLGNLSTLDPEERYREAKRQFEANPTDTQKAQAFLQASKDRGGDSFYYERDFAKVREAIEAGAKALDERAAMLPGFYLGYMQAVNPALAITNPAPAPVVTQVATPPVVQQTATTSKSSAQQADITRLEAKVDALASIGDTMQEIAQSTADTAKYIGKVTDRGAAMRIGGG